MLKKMEKAQNSSQLKKWEENLFGAICNIFSIMEEMSAISMQLAMPFYDWNISWGTILQNPSKENSKYVLKSKPFCYMKFWEFLLELLRFREIKLLSKLGY